MYVLVLLSALSCELILRFLVYLLQAYELCPCDPVICLCLAISSGGRAMQRQADNRHHLVTQVRHFFPDLLFSF